LRRLLALNALNSFEAAVWYESFERGAEGLYTGLKPLVALRVAARDPHSVPI